MDYTQGAMINANARTTDPRIRNPRSQGTRCHQARTLHRAGLPLNMLCDSPTQFTKEMECTQPSPDPDCSGTRPGSAGDRRVHRHGTAVRGSTWYIGGITD